MYSFNRIKCFIKSDDSTKTIHKLNKQIEINESNLQQLKAEISAKNTIEKSLITESETLHTKLKELTTSLESQSKEITQLNMENKNLEGKLNQDAEKSNKLDEDLTFHKTKLASLNKELDSKNTEIRKIEAQLKVQETNVKTAGLKVSQFDKSVRAKMDECSNDRRDLIALQEKYDASASEWETKVNSMSKEIERLSAEKLKLTEAFGQLNKLHTECGNNNLIGVESEKTVLKKLESQVLSAKYEAKVQYLEIEIDTLRSKVRKLLKVKYIEHLFWT